MISLQKKLLYIEFKILNRGTASHKLKVPSMPRKDKICSTSRQKERSVNRLVWTQELLKSEKTVARRLVDPPCATWALNK